MHSVTPSSVANEVPERGTHAGRRRAETTQLAMVLLAALAYWFVFWQYTGNRLEDALITWRYAENLALGHGFTFNPGERVLGTTSPLSALILAGGALLFGTGSIPTIAFWSMGLAGVACGAFSYGALRLLHIARPAALLATALVMFQPDVVRSITGGMETSLLLMLMSLSLLALARGSYYLTGITAGLLFLVRPDSLVWSGLVLLAAVAKSPKRVLISLIPGLIVVGLWLAFCVSYFGDWLPHSVRAKSVITSATRSGVFDVASAVAHFRWALGYIGVSYAEGLPQQSALALWAAAIGVGSVLVMQHHRRPEGMVLVGFPVALTLSYYIANTPHIFGWYLVPLTWALVLVGGIGLGYMLRKWMGPSKCADATRVGRSAAWMVLAIIAIAWADGNRREIHVARGLQEFEDTTRRAVGEWIDAHAPPDASVAMEAIGYQGTYCRRRVIDLAGLISPEVVHIRRESTSNAEAFGKIIDRLRPDYIVLRTAEVELNRHLHGGPLFETAESETRFRKLHTPVRQFDGPSEVVSEPLASLAIWKRRT